MLSLEEEEEIITTFNKHEKKEGFTVVVSYEDIKSKDYSLSAGQYFDVKIEYVDITPKEFEEKMQNFKSTLDSLFEDSKKLGSQIVEQIRRIEL